jgi:response regulator of citrate/malate metabolism
MRQDNHGWPCDPTAVPVLIVDDDGEIQLLLRSVLAHFHHTRIEVARNRVQATEALKERAVRLLFLDINLADGESGFALLETVVSLPAPPFVVMISSDSTAENFRKALQHGAGYFLVKPFTSAKVRTALDRFHFGAQVKAG